LTCSIRQCCFDIVAGVDGALDCMCHVGHVSVVG